MARTKTIDELVAEEIGALKAGGKTRPDYFVPELDLYAWVLPEGIGAVFTHDGEMYRQIDRNMLFYKSICDAVPVEIRDIRTAVFRIPKQHARDKSTYFVPMKLSYWTVEHERAFGIQHKFWRKYKKREGALYYDAGKKWCWFLDLDKMEPYAVICGAIAQMKYKA